MFRDCVGCCSLVVFVEVLSEEGICWLAVGGGACWLVVREVAEKEVGGLLSDLAVMVGGAAFVVASSSTSTSS